MDTTDLLEPFERLLLDIAPSERIRGIERGESAASLWAALEESGFLNGLVSESLGGAGLALTQMAALFQAAGRHLLPVPFAETVIARALLTDAGMTFPAGPIVLVSCTAVGAGHSARAVPLALTAEHALVELGGRCVLTPLSNTLLTPTGVYGSLAADLAWQSHPEQLGEVRIAPGAIRALAAIIRATQIAGAADRLLERTVAYATERVQFGKPIGKQQAIQQQLAVMAEQVVMARMAAQIGCGGGYPPTSAAAAIAKSVASAAAMTIAAIAHAVHGAIGISDEYDLGRYVRCLHEWRIADGSETYWTTRLAAQRMACGTAGSVDFVRAALEPGEPAPGPVPDL